jgi:hypothetical protein
MRGMAMRFGALGLPKFSVGIVLLLPKANVERALATLEKRASAPIEGRDCFNYFRNNCNQVPLRIFEQAGIPLGRATGLSGFSSSLTFRNLFMGALPYAIRSVNAYPLAGVTLAEGQFRSYFPQFLYRAHSVAGDRRHAGFAGAEREYYFESVFLAMISAFGAESEIAAVDFAMAAGIIEKPAEFDFLVGRAVASGFVETNPLRLTGAGRRALAERSLEFDLALSPPADSSAE